MDQIKTYESLMRDLEEETKQKESFKPKLQDKQKPNILDKIDSDIKNQKRFTNYFKSKINGTPYVEEDDNIRLVNNNNNLDSSLENQFNFLMSKYVKDQTTLTNLLNNLTPEMIGEFVHNFGMYEPEIRKYKGQYIDSNFFLDKIRNMLLKNVNIKYPSTRNLNSLMDKSNEPDIEIQKAFEQKTIPQTQITEEEQNQTSALQQLSFIKDWIGTSNKSCNETFEFSPSVIAKFNFNFNQKIDNINQMINLLNKSKSHIDYKDEINIFFNWCKSVYNGSLYEIQLKNEPGSFLTIYFNRIINEYNKIKSPEIDKTFQDYLLKRYEITYGNPNGSGQLPKLESFLVKQTNLDLININNIIEALKTDKQLFQDKKIDRNKLIKSLKEESNNKDYIINGKVSNKK